MCKDRAGNKQLCENSSLIVISKTNIDKVTTYGIFQNITNSQTIITSRKIFQTNLVFIKDRCGHDTPIYVIQHHK